MITCDPADALRIVQGLTTYPRASVPWGPFARFKVIPATETKGTRVLVEAYAANGNRTHRITLPWRYDIDYSDHCETIALLILGEVRTRFEADGWRYYV
jgi:hypothetical protein